MTTNLEHNSRLTAAADGARHPHVSPKGKGIKHAPEQAGVASVKIYLAVAILRGLVGKGTPCLF